MKKIVMIAAIISCTVSATAWADTKYCELTVYQPGFKRYLGEVTYSDTHRRRPVKIRDNNGIPVRFETRLDALAYVTKDGWELVSSYRQPRSDEMHYTLRKQD